MSDIKNLKRINLLLAELSAMIEENANPKNDMNIENTNKSATKRTDGRYMCYANIQGKRKACYGKTEQEAIAKAINMEKEEQQKLDVEIYQLGNIYKECLIGKAKNVNSQTIDRLNTTYNKYYLFSYMNTYDIRNLDSVKISEFLNACIITEDIMTYKEYSKLKQPLKECITYLNYNLGYSLVIDWDYIKEKLPKSRLSNKTDKEYAISSKEVKKLYEVYNKGIYAYKNNTVLAILLNFQLGLRKGELACLRFGDCDFKHNIAKISRSSVKFYERDKDGNKTGRLIYTESKPKTANSIRIIPLTSEAVSILKIIQRDHIKNKYINKPIGYSGGQGHLINTLDATLREMCKQAGIEEKHNHLVRKTFASNLHYKHMPIVEISKLLGHADIITTQKHYIISEDENIEKIRQQLNNALTTNDNKKSATK